MFLKKLYKEFLANFTITQRLKSNIKVTVTETAGKHSNRRINLG